MRVSLCLSLMLIAATPAYAGDPCQTLLCMAGQLKGQSGGSACNQPIDDYFGIVRYGKHWRFSPSATAAARLNYLNGCSSPGVGDWPSQINAVYGTTLL